MSLDKLIDTYWKDFQMVGRVIIPDDYSDAYLKFIHRLVWEHIYFRVEYVTTKTSHYVHIIREGE